MMSNKNTVKDLVLAADGTYVIGIPAIIGQLVSIKHDRNLSIHIFHIGLSERFIKIIKKVYHSYFNGELRLLDIRGQGLEGFTPLRGSIVTYARLLIPKFFNENFEEVFYCDVDVLLLKGFQDFQDVDITGKAVVGVVDPLFNTLGDELEWLDENDPKRKLPYFNAGMIRINLNYWRDYSIMEKALDMAFKEKEKCLRHDQSIMNYLFAGEVIMISEENNLMIGSTSGESRLSDDTAANIHFLGIQNPWMLIFHRRLINFWRSMFISTLGLNPLYLLFTTMPVRFMKENLFLLKQQVKGKIKSILSRV